jgi:hypothetical protein
MRLVRMLVSGLVMAAMLCVGVEGSQLTLGGTAAYAKRHHRKHHRRHKKHARRRHHKRHSSTPEL